MLSDLLMWNKIGRILSLLVGKTNITPEHALDIFYTSETCARLHDPHDFLYLMSDQYVMDELISEMRH